VAFNYQTNESTLLGSIDNLRMPSTSTPLNYMPMLSGVTMPTAAATPSMREEEVEVESDAVDQPSLGVMFGGTEINPNYADVLDEPSDDDDDDADDDAVRGLGSDPESAVIQPYMREIRVLNAPRLNNYRRNYGDDEEQISLLSVDRLNSFGKFTRSPGKRDVVGEVSANVTLNRKKDEVGPFNTDEDFTQLLNLYVPLKFLSEPMILSRLKNAPEQVAIDLVRNRGASLTDQEIKVELDRLKRQDKLTAEANKAAETKTVQITPKLRKEMEKDRLKTRATNAQKYVAFEAAAEKNKKSSTKYKWGVDLSAYGGGPGDVTLASDAAVFQKQAKLESDGIIGPKTLDAVKVIRVRMLAEGAKAKVAPDILKFVTNLKVPGLADARTAGAVTTEKFEQLKQEGVVKEQAKPSEVIKEYVAKTGLRPPAPPGQIKYTPPSQIKYTPPTRSKPAATPVVASTGAALSPAELNAAITANEASANVLGWSTNPAIYPEGARSPQLALDIVYIQRKFNMGGIPGVLSPDVLTRIKNQQLSGLSGLGTTDTDVMQVASRLMSGVRTSGGAPAPSAAPSSRGGLFDNINWWYVGGGVVAIAALGIAFYSTKSSSSGGTRALPPPDAQ